MTKLEGQSAVPWRLTAQPVKEALKEDRVLLGLLRFRRTDSQDPAMTLDPVAAGYAVGMSAQNFRISLRGSFSTRTSLSKIIVARVWAS